MDINVLDSKFNLIDIVDTYQSLIWCKRYNDVGALDLQIEATNENLSVFKKGNYITRNDDDAIYRIEAIELDTNEDKDNSLIVGAYDIKKILNQRIVYDTETYNTTVENAIRGLINNNFINPSDTSRKINNFALKNAKGFTESIQTQITYDVIGEKINELCKTYNYGYKLTRENGVFYFDLFKGVNRSINQSEVSPVVFSPEYDNLVSSKYNLNISEIKNVALVGGEGEGKNRKKIEVGTATGLDRFEMFVDSSGVSSNEGEITDSEYYQILIENGKEQLAQNSTSTSFEGVVDTNLYEYKKDFDLGDMVTLENEYGIKVDARIIEIIETWNDTGYSLEPKFEYMEVAEIVEPTITDAITTEASVMMLSERGVALLSEDSTSVMGVKISELEQTNELKAGCCLPVVQDGETKKVSFETIQSNCIYDDSELQTKINQEITDRKNADTNLQTLISGKANSSHTHDDRYYTESEIDTKLSNKVDKVSGKGLSTNDYTTTEKNKLAGISTGANKTVVDSALSSTSTNPVQNKVVNSALDGKAYRYVIAGAGGKTLYARITLSTYTELITSCYSTQIIFKAGVGGTNGESTNCIPLVYDGYGIQGWYATNYTDTTRPFTLYLKFGSWADIEIIASRAITIERGTTDYLAADFSGVAYKTIPRITKQLSNTLLHEVDTALSSTSTNPVQNKVINSALSSYSKLALTSLWSGTSSTGAQDIFLGQMSSIYTYKFILVEACMYTSPLAQRVYSLIPTSRLFVETTEDGDEFLLSGSTGETNRRVRFKFYRVISSPTILFLYLQKLESNGSSGHLPVITNVWGMN